MDDARKYAFKDRNGRASFLLGDPIAAEFLCFDEAIPLLLDRVTYNAIWKEQAAEEGTSLVDFFQQAMVDAMVNVRKK